MCIKSEHFILRSVLFGVLLFAFGCSSTPLNASGLANGFKGVGTVSYSWSLDSEERLEAENKAKINAVENWISSVHPKHLKNYESVRSEVESTIDSYILDYSVIDSIKDSGTGVYKVVIRATIIEQKLLDKIIGPVSDADADAGDYIAFVFVAREYAGTESSSQKETSNTKSQTKEISKDKGEQQSSQSKSQTQTVRLDKKETELADKTLWRVFQTNGVNTAMGAVYTDAGYAVVDAELLKEETGGLFDPENFIRDYATGDDITSDTKQDAVKGLKMLDEDPIRYLAIGTLDVDRITVDDVTGLPRVAVSATAQVLDIKRRGAALAKVGPVVYSGLGDTEFVAKNNALKIAAEEVANEIVARLRSRNVR